MAFENFLMDLKRAKECHRLKKTEIFMNWSDDNWIANSPQEARNERKEEKKSEWDKMMKE